MIYNQYLQMIMYVIQQFCLDNKDNFAHNKQNKQKNNGNFNNQFFIYIQK